jgi:hypothetical protein
MWPRAIQWFRFQLRGTYSKWRFGLHFGVQEGISSAFRYPQDIVPLINDTEYYLLKLVVTFVPLRAESLAGPLQSAAYTSYTPPPWNPTIPGSRFFSLAAEATRAVRRLRSRVDWQVCDTVDLPADVMVEAEQGRPGENAHARKP